jgi:hypothetical protein
MLTGLLYLGAFAALVVLGRRSRAEAPLRRADTPRLTAMILAGASRRFSCSSAWNASAV